MLYTLSGAPLEAFSKFPMSRNSDVFAPTFNGEGIVVQGSPSTSQRGTSAFDQGPLTGAQMHSRRP